MQPYKKRLNDFLLNVKLSNNDVNNDQNMMPSTSSGSSRSYRSRSNKALSYNDNNENSIDADEIDLALSLAFPNDMENMKKYTDDIWRKTLSSDCDSSIPVWSKQPEVNKTPAIGWPSTSTHGLYSPSNNHFYVEDICSSMSGGNIFFPTSAPTTSTASTTKKSSTEQKHKKKVPGNQVSSTSSIDIDEDFNHIKKRLSLSNLRNSLCRQKAVENLNNNSAPQPQASSSNALDSDEDFLQVAL